MSGKQPFAQNTTARTASVRLPVRAGVDERTGGVLTGSVLAERVGWCIDLVSAMVTLLLTEHGNARDIGVLAAGRDAEGKVLPSRAWVALRRLGWMVEAPVKVNDRIVRIAQEQAGRALRSALWRAEVVAGVLATWPADPSRRTELEWGRVRAAVPGGAHLPAGVIKARTRQITEFRTTHGRLPADVFEVESTPRVARMLLLAACDRQQATLARVDGEPGRALLRLQLPTRPDPASYADWTWVSCPISLPPTVPADAVLHLPTLRAEGGEVVADLAFTHAVPKAARTGHTVAIGVDWGLNTLLSAGSVRLHDSGKITALGAGGQYRAAGVQAKLHRLRRQSEHLHAKAAHYSRLLDGRHDPPLAAKADLLVREIEHVDARRARLNDALAWSAARWTVDQAVAARATVIYLEDLRSMEARGMGRTMNTRLSQTVRGKIAERIRHLAAETGLAVVIVPARGTFRHCPQCLTPLRHRQAPDRPTVPGWKWAICPDNGCGWQGDRDTGAWRRIAARGLAHQTKTVTDKTTGTMVIRTVVDQLETRAVITPTTPTGPTDHRADRSKTGPTAKTSRPAPRRRGAPSPTGPPGPVGKRPEGHAPKDRYRLPRAVHRHQDVTTTSTTTTRGRHRPRGAALGAGFHLHAHATPPQWSEPIPDPQSDTGSTKLISDAIRPG
ncbi:transposase [Streptomyces sp. NPDC060194]|uniref:transposase n=1 Tax=Streptomyces sp. NPDC060194 TaxID=3347069 RepID=UPI0036486830